MHGSHGLFRKGWPHEESVRVPLIVRAPGHAGRDGRPISLLELPAMTAALADGAGPRSAPRDGGGFSAMSMPSVVRLPDQCDRTWTAVRTDARKLVLDGAGEPWLFFDLGEDHLELRNLAGDPSRAGEIAGLARLIRRPSGAVTR
jgi:arylsulfatase A-like enzyme